MEDKEKRKIKFEFLAIPDFFKNQETKEIDEDCLVSRIREINPQITFMAICYSQILDLKFLLEGKGLFAEMRMDRDLKILSNGQILTMNPTQKEFIQSLAMEDNVEKDVVITGPVGSGKTLLGLEAINIKMAHYKKKYGISSNDCRNKLWAFILIARTSDDSQLKLQLLKMFEYVKGYSVEIVISGITGLALKEMLEIKSSCYSHIVVMADEIWRYIFHTCIYSRSTYSICFQIWGTVIIQNSF